MSKILPLDKTVVTEFSLQVVDIHLRQRFLKGSVSAKVPQDANFIQGDVTLFPDEVLLNNIRRVFAIHSFSPMLLDISNNSGQILNLDCNGLFILYGSLDSVVMKALKPTRVTYLYF